MTYNILLATRMPYSGKAKSRKRVCVLLCLAALALPIQGLAQSFYGLDAGYGELENPASLVDDDYFTVGVHYRSSRYAFDELMNNGTGQLKVPLYNENRRFGGLGFQLQSQRQGEHSAMRRQGIGLGYAHQVALGKQLNMSLGLQAGYFQQKLEGSVWTTGSQWDPLYGYNSALPSGELAAEYNATDWELTSGVMFYTSGKFGQPDYYLSVAAHRLNKPSYSSWKPENALPVLWESAASARLAKGTHWQFALFGRHKYTPDWKYYAAGARVHADLQSLKGAYWQQAQMAFTVRYSSFHRGLFGVHLQQPNYRVGIAYETAPLQVTETPMKGTFELSVVFCSLRTRHARKQVAKPATPAVPVGNWQQKRVFSFDQQETFEREVEALVADKDARREPSGKTSKGEAVAVRLARNFQYAFNDAGLNDQAREFLEDLARLLRKDPAVHLEIVGHTDNVGSADANGRVAQDRARAVQQFLQQQGIAAERLRIVSKGATEPLVPNSSDENRARNRRVEFIMYY